MIYIALVDDNDLFRKSLKAYFKQIKRASILFDAVNGHDLLEQLRTQLRLPDIILMDFSMPVLDGRQATEKVKKLYPDIKVIVLSMFHHDHLISSMISAGAKGFLSKNIEAENLERAIHTVMDNKYFIETDNERFEIFDSSTADTKKLCADQLIITEKQKQFLQLNAGGLTYLEIARKMGISIKTADNYRDMLFKRFNVTNRVGLAMFAIQNGLTDILG